jgi:hypothetical protein
MTWLLTSTWNGVRYEAEQGVDGDVKVNRAMQLELFNRGRDLYGNVDDRQVRYEAKGDRDPVAAYLNVLLAIPGSVTLAGDPPKGAPVLNGNDTYGPLGAPIPQSSTETKQLPPVTMGTRHDGAMVALIPDKASARNLAVVSGYPAEDLHCTLAYLGDAATFTGGQSDLVIALIVAMMGNGRGDITANVSGAGTLGPDDATVYLLGDSDFLKFFQEDVMDTLNTVAGRMLVIPPDRLPWIAHITAGEHIDPKLLTYRGPVTFDRVRIKFGAEQTDIPLDGMAMPPDEAVTLDTANGPVTLRKSVDDDPGAIPGLSAFGLLVGLEGKAVSPGGRPINYGTLNRSPKRNWVEVAGELPPYIRGVARGIAKKHGGKVTGRDIAIAISRMKVWAAGGDHVRPAVQAAAAAAVAQWEALKAKIHARKK